jgi:hypothetical protein
VKNAEKESWQDSAFRVNKFVDLSSDDVVVVNDVGATVEDWQNVPGVDII